MSSSSEAPLEIPAQGGVSNRSRQRIMFLYLHTGGGHISATRALARDIEARYPDDEAEIHIVNGLGPVPTFRRKFVEDGYTIASSQLPFIWPVMYNINSYAPYMALQTNFMRLGTVSFLVDYIREHDITKVVILHFLMIRPLYSALMRLGKTDMKTLTIITDPFTVHNYWSFRQYMPIIVFSQQAKRRVMRRLAHLALKGSPARGPNPEVRVMPPILDKRFAKRLTPAENRANRIELGFDPDKPLILLAGGGEGLPEGERYLAALARAGLDVQIVMVCGKNKIQLELATLISRVYGDASIRLFGFVDIMYQLMNMADIIVTKGGPATVFEILALQKPLIISKYLYGQEQGNVDFVVNNGLGWYEPKPTRFVRRIRQLLDNPASFDEVHRRLEKLEIGIGTEAISDYIIKL